MPLKQQSRVNARSGRLLSRRVAGRWIRAVCSEEPTSDGTDTPEREKSAQAVPKFHRTSPKERTVLRRYCCRLHPATIVGTLAVGAVMTWIDLCGEPYIDVDWVIPVYGWPFVYTGYSADWNATAINYAAQAITVLACTAVIERWSRVINRFQWRLSNFFMLTFVAAVQLALTHFNPWFPDCEFGPMASFFRWHIRVPILFGLGCIIYLSARTLVGGLTVLASAIKR